ncbi:hypothetical protein ES288_A10G165200v1 [Gossypium darwinii]|nr:hypothetical protein ES288_A10G165200v1 [Gossypium darwinii]
MANKRDKGFYHSLSRKELQSLCKKYGLPANRSSSDMGKSVASYLETQRLGSMTTTERSDEIQESGIPLALKPPFRNADKDFYGLISCPADSFNGGNYPQSVKCNAFGCCAGDKFYHKDGYGVGSTFFQQTPQPQFVTQYNDNGSRNNEFPTTFFNRNCLTLTRDGRMNDMPQTEHKDTNVGACSNEAAFCSSINTPTLSPSFQFHEMSHSKSQSFHKELGCFGESSKPVKDSFQLNVDAEKIKDSNIQSGLPPSLIIKENDALQLDHLDGDDDGPLDSTVMTSRAEAVEVSQLLEGHQGLSSFKALPDFQDEVNYSGVSSAKDGCLITLDSNINSPQEMLASDGLLNISDGPLNLLTVKHQNSNLENEICDNSALHKGSNLVSSGEIGPGCLSDGSLQMPMPMPKDVVHQKNKLHPPRGNGQFVNLVDPKHNIYADPGGLVGSTGLDQETYRNQLPILVEEQDRSKIINWGESLECSHNELFENCGMLDNVDSNGLGKKGAYVSGDQNNCSMLDSKVLRSAKHLSRKVLPRRSMRLVSK